MRLVFAFLVGTLPALALPLMQQYEIPFAADTQHMFGQREVESARRIEDTRHAPAADPNRDNSANGLGWAWRVTKRGAFFVLLGWFVGRILIPYRHLIALSMALVVIVTFVLVEMDLVQFTIRYENVERMLQAVKVAIWSIGLIEFFATILGSWAGVSGFLAAHRRRRERMAEGLLAKAGAKGSESRARHEFRVS